jgi:hypothetical protein
MGAGASTVPPVGSTAEFRSLAVARQDETSGLRVCNLSVEFT